jgi:hypothetical protein
MFYAVNTSAYEGWVTAGAGLGRGAKWGMVSVVEGMAVVGGGGEDGGSGGWINNEGGGGSMDAVLERERKERRDF